ncbi:ABC transporter substrate-binding protein [Halogeometricum limi]|uniref:Peptide/nickel transport system substrate-binding protein n=1 Tax=Halogeometricum limi TaxID=555875 RepID=A0A1I6HBJ6_9EURY|nr:ABC transporter substrate-binding protein [Halogeometricum limi]SFR51886.1 peptide/nickel transport system substrate-binding protein [Halogeometricum limi]
MTDENDSPSRRRVLQAIGAAGVTGLAGCSGGGGDEGTATGTDAGGATGTATETSESTGTAESSGATLNFAQSKSALDFDPLKANDVPSLQVTERIFDSLYTYEEGTTLTPQLAAGEPEINGDGTQYTVTLKDDITFHNGEPITAEDVKYSYLAPAREETENGSEFTMIDEITVVDEKTVQFDLKYPFGPFKHKLAWAPVPKAAREEDREGFNSDPVGSGPYELEDWQEGSYVRMTRHEDYWGEKPEIQTLNFTPVSEPTTRVTTLRNGENHIVQTVPPKLYSTVEGISEASVQERGGLGYYYLAFNCNEGPTADKKVREAIDYAVSMDQAVQNYVEPAGTRMTSPLPQSIIESWGFPGEEWADIAHDKDLTKAEQLLEEAGVDKDYDWTIIVPPDDKREQIGITVSNALQELGFSNASVQRLDWGAFLDKYATGDEDDYNMYTLGWVDEVDPDGFLYFLFHESEEGSTNGCYYENDEVMRQLDEARKSPDRETRKELYTKAVTSILEDRAHLPAYNLKNSFGVRSEVKGFRPHTISGINPRMTGPLGSVTLDD